MFNVSSLWSALAGVVEEKFRFSPYPAGLEVSEIDLGLFRIFEDF